MGTIFRKFYTKPIPPGSALVKRKGKKFARWQDPPGRTRIAEVIVPHKGKFTGEPRLKIEAKKFTAKYRDGSGVVREVATGCSDETAARAVLATLVQRAELVKSGVMSVSQDAVSNHQDRPLREHIADFLTALEARGSSSSHHRNYGRYLHRLINDCAWSRLNDIRRELMEKWLNEQRINGMSARSRNAHRAALAGFCSWCVEVKRLLINPVVGIPMANEKTDPRRPRRSLTESELLKLLESARQRPVLDATTIRRGSRKGQTAAIIGQERRQELELLGYERSLIYKTLILTGLRKGELGSVTVGQLRFDEPVAYLSLNAADEKNRKGADIPLRADLAHDLLEWLDRKLKTAQSEARFLGEPIPDALSPRTPLFKVPAGLLRILDRDLRLAGIPKRDEEGRTIDVHALRHTFGTLLSKGGVAPRTAQAAMRHSSIDLTMNVYTDPRLLDVAGALESLPSLPLCADRLNEGQATGTDVIDAPAPMLAPTADNSAASRARAVKTNLHPGRASIRTERIINAYGDGDRHDLSIADNRGREMEPAGLEPATSCMPCSEPSGLSAENNGVTDVEMSDCTTACTSSTENAPQSFIEGLISALRSLSPEDRAAVIESIRKGTDESTS